MKVDDARVQLWFGDERETGPFVYFSGATLKTGRGNRAISSRVDAVRKLYDAGLIDLVQRRIPQSDQFDYLAQKRAVAIKIPHEWTFRAHEMVS